MDKFLDYNLLEQLYSSDTIVVYRGLRKEDGSLVVLKTLKAEYPAPEDLARLTYEYNLIKDLNIDSFIKAYALESQQNQHALILESFQNSSTLRSYIKTNKLSLEKFLHIAIQLVDAIGKLHEAHIIHKDINPDNILVTKDGEQIKLIDLSIAAQLEEEQEEMINAAVLEGTFPYISPEQTTRMNRPIDHRTDFYSLGVTLYEMLTGRLPFEAKDPIEWVHYHIAKQPVAPNELVKDIPKVISDIVMKLLSKSADDRYASALGLKKDLETCLNLWKRTNTIAPFELGTEDRKGTFRISKKLYGREIEVQQLLSAFERVSRGATELLLVSGYAGIGKSSLINEVQKPIVQHRGYFAKGKYDQYQRDIPYAGLIEAFRNLINQLLTENVEKIAYWREKLLKAISPNGQIITNVIPELEKLIGKQPDVVELPPAEARNRFELVFFDFVSTFAKKDNPLVIFLDDLQWADIGSFNLIKHLLKDTEMHYFLLIGSYRDNEVDSTHPVFEMIDEFKNKNVVYSFLNLFPLNKENIKLWLQDTLQGNNDIETLAQLVMEKTAGNPFFVNLFLTTLYKAKYLKYDPINQWTWDIAALRSLPITDNVADLVVTQIYQLQENVQETLKIGSCIGMQFDSKIIASLLNKSAKEVNELLWIALKEKWIVIVKGDYKLATVNLGFAENQSIVYKFAHDRIHQVLYLLLTDEERKNIHLKIGRLLLADYSEQNENNLFNIAYHFSKCLDLLKPEEKSRIATLFQRAAYKAQLSNSYDVAITYYKYAIDLWGQQIWDSDYALIFKTQLNYITCQALLGEFEKADTQYTDLLNKTTDPLAKVKIVMAQSYSYASRSEYTKATALIEKLLSTLGLTIPRNISKFRVIFSWLRCQWWLRKKTTDDLLNLPIMQGKEKMAIMELLSLLIPAIYVSEPNNINKAMYLVISGIYYSLRHGNHITSANIYLYYGQIEVIRNNVERAFQFGQLAIKLAERFNDLNLPVIYFLAGIRIFPWKLPYKECYEILQKSSQLSYAAGQLYCYQHAAMASLGMLYLINAPIPEIEKKVHDYLNNYQCTCNKSIYFYFKIYLKFIEVLTGKNSIQEYHESLTDWLSQDLSTTPLIAVLPLKTYQLILSYLFDDVSLAFKSMRKPDEHVSDKIFDTLAIAPGYYYYTALILLNSLFDGEKNNRARYKKELKSILEKFKKWTAHAPSNFIAQYLLLQSGMCALDGNIDKALSLHEQAIMEARKNDRTFLEGIAHEFMARILIRRHQLRSARSYLQYAYAAYHQCGANGKTEQLQNKYPDLLKEIPQALETVTQTGSQHYHSSRTLDISTIIKSTQIISSQVKLEDFLKTLITIVLENAGAERGLILLMENNQLVVEAENKLDSKSSVLQREPVERRTDLPLSIVQFVQNSQEPVILDDAANEGAYTQDPYIVHHKPLSILCIPILYQNYLFGVLYLENNLTRHAFTTNHLDLLQVLSAQIAISLENIRLYKAYDQFIPHEFLDILGKRKVTDIRLGDNVQKEMTVVFTDIRGFSKLSEELTSAEIFKVMNDYLGYMEPIIKKHGGFIDKYIGDAIMALFAGGPDSAVLAAIDMQKELVNFNQKQIVSGKSPISIGSGINTGNLVLGTLGSHGRLETSVISDAVNVAERIEELTKEYGCRVLIGESTYKSLASPDRFDIRFIDRTEVRGREQKIGIWEVYNGDDDDIRFAKLSISKHYNEGIMFFQEKSYQKALNIFQRCLTGLPYDKVIKKYIERCQYFLKKVSDKDQSEGTISAGE